MKKKYKRSLIWLRRDLRLYDHRALSEALANSEEIICVFVFDQNILDRLLDRNDRRVSYIYQSLLEIRDQVRSYGSDLIMLYGDPVKLIPEMANKLSCEAVFVNRDYEKYARERDKKVKGALSENRQAFHDFTDHIVYEANQIIKTSNSQKSKNPYYSVYTPYKNTWINRLREEDYHAIRERRVDGLPESLMPKSQIGQLLNNIQAINELSGINFVEPSRLIVSPGAKAARFALEEFLARKANEYGDQRDYPNIRGCSVLSTAMRFGTISIRECFRQAFQLLDQYASELAGENIQVWINELIWREFYSMILQIFPEMDNLEYQERYRGLPWLQSPELLERWQIGRTGIPIVDAGMRELLETGLMHNRVRMIVGSFLTKNLFIDWRKGEQHFARYLLDYELASNAGNWQWIASVGTDAAPYFRVFNPAMQSAKFDKDAGYIKQWIPELRDCSSKDIHNLKCQINNYPAPIVDLKSTRQRAITIFKSFNN